MLIDEQLKPWLIEVNASPSLTCTTEDDRKLKDRVMRDALAVAVPPGKLEAAAGGVSRTTALSRLSRGGRSGVGGDKGAARRTNGSGRGREVCRSASWGPWTCSSTRASV